MRICFLLQEQYWPYSKWFGSAFACHTDEDDLADALAGVLDARNHEFREQFLVEAYERVAARHNASELMKHVDPSAASSTPGDTAFFWQNASWRHASTQCLIHGCVYSRSSALSISSLIRRTLSTPITLVASEPSTFPEGERGMS